MGEKVTVYFFRKFDVIGGEYRVSNRRATLEAIERARGEPIMDSAIQIGDGELDEEGFRRVLKHRILRQLHATPDGGGFTLYVTHHNDGKGDVYRSETRDGTQIAWNTLDEVKKRTAARLLDEGHTCSDKCSDWELIED